MPQLEISVISRRISSKSQRFLCGLPPKYLFTCPLASVSGVTHLCRYLLTVEPEQLSKALFQCVGLSRYRLARCVQQPQSPHQECLLTVLARQNSRTLAVKTGPLARFSFDFYKSSISRRGKNIIPPRLPTLYPSSFLFFVGLMCCAV